MWSGPGPAGRHFNGLCYCPDAEKKLGKLEPFVGGELNLLLVHFESRLLNG